MNPKLKSINALIYGLAVVTLVVGYLGVTNLLRSNYGDLLSAQIDDKLSLTESAISTWTAARKKETAAEARLQILSRAITDLTPMAADREVLLTSPVQLQLRQHFSPYLVSAHIKGFSLLDLQGRVLADAAPLNVGRMSPVAQHSEQFARAVAGSVEITPLTKNAPLTGDADENGSYETYSVAPIRDVRGDIIGLFALRLNLEDEVLNLVQFTQMSAGFVTYAFTKTGRLLTHPESLVAEGTLDPESSKTPAYVTANSQPGGDWIFPLTDDADWRAGKSLVGYTNFMSQKVIGGWLFIEDLGIGIATEQNYFEAYDLSQMFINLTALAFGIGLVVATAVFLTMLEFGQKANLQRAKLSAIMSATRDVNFQVRSDGTISEVNDAVLNVFGIAPDKGAGRQIASFIDLGTDQRVPLNNSTLFGLAAASGKEVLRAKGWRVDGTSFPIGIHIEKLKKDTSEEREYLVVVHDYSEIEKREKELTAALHRAEAGTKTKSSFLSTISHELRSPLISVIAALELLVDRSKSREERNLLDSSQRSAQLLLGTIDDILDYSRIEVDGLELSLNEVTPEAILSDVTEILRWQAWNNNVTLIPYCAPALPMVRADGLRLRQILLNVIGNAIKFSSQLKQTGRVEVSISTRRQSGNEVSLILTVSDNGIGMGQDTMNKIFLPFTQADGSIRRRYGGTGLGLSITEKLVRIMEGHVSVSSSLGEGTVFSIEIPVARSDRSIPPNYHNTSLKDRQIVLLSRDSDVQNVIRRYCEFAGATVRFAVTPEDARATFDAADAVIIHGPNTQVTQEIAGKLGSVKTLQLTSFETNARPDGDVGEALDLVTLTPGALISGLEDLIAGARGPSVAKESYLPQTRVLLVEDDKMTREITLRMLTNLGITADAVENGEEGLHKWRSGKYALLLSDCHMPIMDGFQMSAQIRDEEGANQLPQTPIIAVSADLTMEIERLCEESKINEYIPKPLTPDKLKSILKQYLSNGKPHHDA